MGYRAGSRLASASIAAMIFLLVLPLPGRADQTPGTEKWSVKVGGATDLWSIRSSPAIGPDGTIYVGSEDGTLYAVDPGADPEDNPKSFFLTSDSIFSSPAVAPDGTIYIGSDDGNLYAISPNGEEKWRFQTGGSVFSSPAIGPDGTIYVGSDDGNLYAINPDGTQKWLFPTGGLLESSPAIGPDGTIYVGSYDKCLYAINPDGSKKWALPTGGSIISSPALSADGTIYAGSCDGKLYAIDRTGSEKWAFPTDGCIYSSPAIGADGTVYVGSNDGNLYAFDPEGNKKWAFPTGDCILSSPAIGADGTIYFGSDDWYFYAITPAGKKKWPRLWLDAYIESSPVIAPDGTIYVASYNDDTSETFLHAIYSDSPGMAEADWPMFHGHAAHTGVGPGNAGSLGVTPLVVWKASGIEGGPFSPAAYSYQLTNSGETELSWGVSTDANWLTAEKSGGTLAPGGSVAVTLQIETATAGSLPCSRYQGTVTFENLTVQATTPRTALLTVNPTPGHLLVTPEEGFHTSGNPGGPFDPASAIYTLQNAGHVSLDWEAASDAYWLNISPDSGRLEPCQTTEVTVSLNQHANDMQLGNYTGHIYFCNRTNIIGNTTLTAHLNVVRFESEISCILPSDSLTLGEYLSVSGQISPPPSECGAWVSIVLEPPSGDAVYRSTQADENGIFSCEIGCEDITRSGHWKVRAGWSGDPCYQGAVSEPQALTVSKGGSRITIDAGSKVIKVGDLVDISGKFTPDPDCGSDLSGKEIKIVILGPEGRSDFQSVATSDRFGHFVLQDYARFDALGEWFLQAVFMGDCAHEDSRSEVLSVQVVETAGYAVIVEGKIEGGEGLDSHRKTARYVYRQLLQRGFLDEDIYYLGYEESKEVDGVPTRENVKEAITVWARDRMNTKPANFYLILVDHGLEDKFYIFPDVLTSGELGDWLNRLQSQLSGQAAVQEIVVLLGFCRSGSFLDDLSGWNRVLIASAAADEASYKGPLDPVDGVRHGEFFITEFFRAAATGKDVFSCFMEGAEKTTMFTSTGTGEPNAPYSDDARQHPLLDDNGDGKGENSPSGSPGGDGYLSRRLYIGVGSVTGNAPGDVQVTDTSKTQFLEADEGAAAFWARVNDNTRMCSLWMILRPPGYEPNPGGTEQIEMDLPWQAFDRYDQAGDRYEWNEVSGFDTPGTYQIFFFARDNDTGNESSLRQTVVYKAKAANNPPGPFDLLFPSNGLETRTTVLLLWSECSDPDQDPVTYTVEIAEDPDFTVPVHRAERLMQNHYFLDSGAGLKDLTTYYWRVTAVDCYGARTVSSEISSFETNNTNPLVGWILGRVYDVEGGKVVTDAVVSIGSYNFNTLPTGDYLGLLPAGTYSATVTAGGYTKASLPEVVIPEGGIVTKNFELQPAAPPTNCGDLAEVISALQVMVGNNTSSASADGDIDGDGKIGLAEAIYTMQKLAGLGD